MAAQAMHAICHRENGRPLNFRNINAREGVYGSGWWTLEPQTANEMIGSWLYLHEASGQRSHFVGKIEGVSEPDAEGRYEFVVRKQIVGDHPWRGGKPGQHPRHYYKIVHTSYEHESQA